MFNKDEIQQLAQRRTRTFGQMIRVSTANPLPVRSLHEIALEMHAKGQPVFRVMICIQCGARVFTDVHGTPFEPMACGH